MCPYGIYGHYWMLNFSQIILLVFISKFAAQEVALSAHEGCTNFSIIVGTNFCKLERGERVACHFRALLQRMKK